MTRFSGSVLGPATKYSMDDQTPTTIEPNPIAKLAATAEVATERWIEATRKRPGRPSLKTEELVAEIRIRLACGESLRRIAKDDHMPNYSTMKEWRMDDPEFKAITNEAYEELAHTYREIHMDLLMGDLSLGTHQDNKNAADGIKWQAAKLNRVDFGERVDVTSNGNTLPSVILPTIALPSIPDAEFEDVESLPKPDE